MQDEGDYLETGQINQQDRKCMSYKARFSLHRGLKYAAFVQQMQWKRIDRNKKMCEGGLERRKREEWFEAFGILIRKGSKAPRESQVVSEKSATSE